MTTRDEVLSGGAALDALLRTLPLKMRRNVNTAGLRAGAAVFLREVQQNIPVDTGNLRATARISTRSGQEGVSVSVKVGGQVVKKKKGKVVSDNDAWYARLVEYGTRPHYIFPKKRGGALQFGGITRGVLHSGARPRPFMRPAVDSKFPEAVRAIEAKIRQRLAKEGLNTPDPLPVGDE